MMQNTYNDGVKILGRAIHLTPLPKTQLSGLTVGERLSYDFYTGVYQGQQLAFAKPKGDVQAPRGLAITARKVAQKLEMPLVYILPACPAYLRQRLIDKGVYFIVSNKFALLPNLVINERVSTRKEPKLLSPVAQYILLYHLQVKSLNDLTAQDLKRLIPYSYPSISLGLRCLEDLGLLLRKAEGKNKMLRFTSGGKELFERSKQYMIDPVARRIYCDNLTSEEQFPASGTNALAHYTALNPDRERMIAMSKQSFDRLKAGDALEGENTYDGNILIEVWKYPPVTINGYAGQWVDPLSLALSLADDQDPRVENEVDHLINEIKW